MLAVVAEGEKEGVFHLEGASGQRLESGEECCSSDVRDRMGLQVEAHGRCRNDHRWALEK